MGKIYWSLFVREADTTVWSVQFGDYSRQVVAQERKDSYSEYPREDWIIVPSGDTQAEINAALAEANKVWNKRGVGRLDMISDSIVVDENSPQEQGFDSFDENGNG